MPEQLSKCCNAKVYIKYDGWRSGINEATYVARCRKCNKQVGKGVGNSKMAAYDNLLRRIEVHA